MTLIETFLSNNNKYWYTWNFRGKKYIETLIEGYLKMFLYVKNDGMCTIPQNEEQKLWDNINLGSL